MPGNAETSANRWPVDCHFECKAFGSIAIYCNYSQLPFIQIAWAERICFHFPDNPYTPSAQRQNIDNAQISWPLGGWRTAWNMTVQHQRSSMIQYDHVSFIVSLCLLVNWVPKAVQTTTWTMCVLRRRKWKKKWKNRSQWTRRGK